MWHQDDKVFKEVSLAGGRVSGSRVPWRLKTNKQPQLKYYGLAHGTYPEAISARQEHQESVGSEWGVLLLRQLASAPDQETNTTRPTEAERSQVEKTRIEEAMYLGIRGGGPSRTRLQELCVR